MSPGGNYGAGHQPKCLLRQWAERCISREHNFIPLPFEFLFSSEQELSAIGSRFEKGKQPPLLVIVLPEGAADIYTAVKQ